MSAPLLEHFRQHRPGQKHRPRQIDLHGCFNSRCGLAFIGGGDFDAGIVDQDVRCAELLLRLFGEALHLGRTSEIGRDCDGIYAQRLHLVANLFERIHRSCSQCQIDSLPGESAGDVYADAS